ncbi:MAG: hypothetical protein KDE55_08880 [Novosphingobium sp.]|nr:hypothetical protein [Novosphingobium sp.]
MQGSEMTIAIIALLVIVAALAVWMFVTQRRTSNLRQHFGDEYDRTLDEHGTRGKAEANLIERKHRVEKLNIRPLTENERAEFTTEWTEVKSIFVNSPAEAVLHADRMLARMMKLRGYPMADFDHRFEDLTVDHQDVALHYREGHLLAERQERGEASTEDLRQAMIHYETLFDELVFDTVMPELSEREAAHVH